MLPSNSSQFFKFGHHRYIKDIVERTNRGESPADFLNEYDENAHSKTYRNMGRIVSLFVNWLEELANMHEVHLSEINIIFRIIIDAMGYQWTTDKLVEGELVEFQQDRFIKRIFAYYNDTVENPCDKISFENFSNEDILAKMVCTRDLRKILDGNNLIKNADRLMYHCDFYLPKKLSDEENKEKFLSLYQIVYDHLVEAIWFFILSSMLDYLMIAKIDNSSENLASWSRFSQEIGTLENLKSEEFSDYVYSKYFWVKIFFEKIFISYSKEKMSNRLVETALRQRDFNETSSGDYDQEIDNYDVRIREYDREYDEDSNYDQIQNFIEEEFSVFNRQDNVSYQSAKGFDFPFVEYNRHYIDFEKELAFPHIRAHFEKYFLNKYELSGDPQKLINYLNNYIRKGCQEYVRKQMDDSYRKRYGFSLKTGKKIVKDYNEKVQDDSQKIRYCTDLPDCEIKKFLRENKDKIKQKIPGYKNRSEIANAMSSRFNVSSKTITRKLKKFEEEGKIPPALTFKGYTGKYYKDEYLAEIGVALKSELS